VGAQNFVDPYVCKTIIEELPSVLEKYGYQSVQEAVGRSWKDE
jgi:dihydroorotate dehydrogenase (NAD+) catalytic subunit